MVKKSTARAEELVPGDIVLMETGDRIPDDLRILGATKLRVAESALTGDSESVSRLAAPDKAPTASATAKSGCLSTVACYKRARIGRRCRNRNRNTVWATAISIVVIVAGIVRAKPIVEMFMTATGILATTGCFYPSALPFCSSFLPSK
jgi:P-type E1-E2 ATPase